MTGSFEDERVLGLLSPKLLLLLMRMAEQQAELKFAYRSRRP